MAAKPIRVLGVDTSLRSTGVGVIEVRGNSISAVEFGAIKTPQKHPHSECLKRLYDGIEDIIARHSPDLVAIEGAFYCKNVRTAMILGEARGVAIAACARKGLSVFEYAPRKVKQAVTGNGAASKEQIRKMIMTMMGLDEEPQEDAGDALAIAVCHVHNMSGHEALAPKAI